MESVSLSLKTSPIKMCRPSVDSDIWEKQMTSSVYYNCVQPVHSNSMWSMENQQVYLLRLWEKLTQFGELDFWFGENKMEKQMYTLFSVFSIHFHSHCWVDTCFKLTASSLRGVFCIDIPWYPIGPVLFSCLVLSLCIHYWTYYFDQNDNVTLQHCHLPKTIYLGLTQTRKYQNQ